MNVNWKWWTESKCLNDDIVKYEAKELDECLSRFFAEIRKSFGSDCEPDGLRVTLAALDRHLKRNIHSEGPRIRQVQTGPVKKPRKTTTCNKSTYCSRWRVAKEKLCTWRTKSKVTQNSHPVLSSSPIQHNRTATLACKTVVHHFHGCQVTINYGHGVSAIQQCSN